MIGGAEGMRGSSASLSGSDQVWAVLFGHNDVNKGAERDEQRTEEAEGRGKPSPLFHSRGSESFCFNFHCRPITKRMIASLRINLASCLEANSSNNAPKGRIQTWPVFPGRSHHLRLLGGQTITVPLDIVCSHIIDQRLPRSLHRMREKCIQQLSGVQPIHPDFLLLGLSRPH